MKKIIEIYKDSFEAVLDLLDTDGFKFCASVFGLICIAVISILFSIWLANNGLTFILYLLGETLLLLPVYVKLCRKLDEY